MTDKTFTSIGNVSELADSIELDKILADCGLQELGVKFSNTVDLARTCNIQDSRLTVYSKGTSKPHR